MGKRELAIKIAWEHYNTPYIWGGKKPLIGLDCSGFVQAVLVEMGILNRWPVLNSRMLWKRWDYDSKAKPGNLVFYGKQSRVNHVMICLNNKFCIGAAGGNSKCLSVQKAAMLDARVKVMPINYRKDIVGFIDPFKEV